MDVPKIKLTMLGAAGSGKTTLMYGMYAILASGLHGYHLYTVDPDDHIDLMEAWEQLYEHGRLPVPTSTDPVSYQMTFNYGLETLLHLDFVDFRGGAGTESGRKADAPEDIRMLRERLAESDSIYLVLDGRYVGEWLAEGCPAMQLAGPMKIQVLGRYITEQFQRRREAGLPSPSLVLVISKSDVLAEVSGLSGKEARDKMLQNMQNLVPFAYQPGVTALICPVQLGRFGLNPGLQVDHRKVQPTYVHKPLIFSLMHYLQEQMAVYEHGLSGLRSQHSAALRELDDLREGFMSIFRGGRIREKSNEIDWTRDQISDLQKDLGTARQRAGQLMDQLVGLPIIKDGKEFE